MKFKKGDVVRELPTGWTTAIPRGFTTGALSSVGIPTVTLTHMTSGSILSRRKRQIDPNEPLLVLETKFDQRAITLTSGSSGLIGRHDQYLRTMDSQGLQLPWQHSDRYEFFFEEDDG